MSILDELGFETESCTPGKKQPHRRTELRFSDSGAVLDIEADVADRIVEIIGDRVEFGLTYGMKIAICKGDSRTLTRGSGGRRKLNLNSAKDNLLAYFPSGANRHGRMVLETAFVDEIDFDEENGVVVFKPNGFRYRDGSGTHYGTASDLGIG